MKSIVFQSATQITQQIRDKQISCKSVIEQFLDHIKRVNGFINAISDLRDYDDLMDEARHKDKLLSQGILLGALHGLPMTVKDSYNILGLISCNGNPKLKSNIAISNADKTTSKRQQNGK